MTSTNNEWEWKPGHPHPESPYKRVRTAKGHRPHFFDDPNIDKLMAMVMALTTEVSVLRDRLDTHERLAAKKEWADHEAIEAYQMDDIADAYRTQARSEFIARVLRILQTELDEIAQQDAETAYEEIMKEVSQ